MKLRKLILSAKLKEIEKENQNILVFHCNLTAAEWRQLKNLLRHENFSESQESNLTYSNYKIFFLSKSISSCIESSRTENTQNGKDLKEKETNQKQMKLAGCLFFFNPKSKDLDLQECRLKPSELMKKFESSDFNNNLLLLYGQMNHIPLNHLDLKRALQLDPQETYQQLLFSIQLLSASLNSFLYQNINDFIQIQQQISSNLLRDPVNVKPLKNKTEANNGN